MEICGIKRRLKSGDIAGAESAATELLAEKPDDVRAKILYGICRQLQGDETAFRRIHDELAPKMGTVADDETRRMWEECADLISRNDAPRLVIPTRRKKVNAKLEYLIVGGVVAIAAGVAAYCFGKRLRHDMEVALSARSAYMGPVAERLQIETSSGKQVANDMPSVKTDSR